MPLTGDPSSSLVGREAELAVIEQFLDDEHGRRCLVVCGEAGIGKTTLWEAANDLARARGCHVLTARGSEAEAQLSFVGLSDLLSDVDPAALAELPPPQSRALDIALRRADAGGAVPESLAISSGLLGALRLLARDRQVVVAFDDIQSADPPSADALAFAARRLGDHRVRLVLSRRPGNASGVERASTDGSVELFEVGPLSFGATNHMLADRLSEALPRRVLHQLFEMSQGNPLFALELGRAVIDRGIPDVGGELPVPELLEDLFAERVSILAPSIRHALLGVALSGSLSRNELRAMIDPFEIDDAVSAGVLVADRDRLRPSHPLLAAAATRGAGARERRDLHLELAGVVADVTLRARHRALAAGAPELALANEVAAAAAVAKERGVIQDAIELADHALRLTPVEDEVHTDRVLELARLLHIAGDHLRATAVLSESLKSLPRGRARAEAHLLLGEVAEYSREREHFERALEESANDPALRARALARSSVLMSVSVVERLAEAERLALEALQLARSAESEIERRARLALAWARILQGRSIDDLREGTSSEPVGSSLWEASIERPAGVRFAFRGELDQARALFRRMLRLADERGEARSGLVIMTQLLEVEQRAGNAREAVRLLDEWGYGTGLERDIETDIPHARLEAGVAMLVGDAERVARLTDVVLAGSPRESGFGWDRLEAWRTKGLAALLVHEPARAAECLRETWAHSVRERIDDPGAFPVAGDLVEALVETGEIDEARSVIERLQRLARQQDHPWGLATAKRSTASVALALDYDEQEVLSLEEAAAEYGRLGLHFDEARTLLFLGKLQRRARKRAECRRTLEAAASIFEQCGCTGWEDEARAELARISGRRTASEGELTPSERRVAECAAGGLSNKEIAAQLFISVYTVESHLRHAYAKLGIRSRAQLAGSVGKDT